MNDEMTSVAPISSTPVMPPTPRVLPAASIRKRGGCSVNRPSSDSANTRNAVPMTVLVAQCAAKRLICSPTSAASAPISVNMPTMPAP